jgi:NADH-quinone oxidoreductase subunit K
VTPGPEPYLLLGALLFGTGLYGVLTRRDLVGIVVAIELMANAANINLVTFGRFGGHAAGPALALFGIALTVAEVSVGLALLVLVSRTHRTTAADALSEMKG